MTFVGTARHVAGAMANTHAVRMPGAASPARSLGASDGLGPSLHRPVLAHGLGHPAGGGLGNLHSPSYSGTATCSWATAGPGRATTAARAGRCRRWWVSHRRWGVTLAGRRRAARPSPFGTPPRAPRGARLPAARPATRDCEPGSGP